MDYDEKIQAHILSVWRESKKIFSVLGTEGMLFITNHRLIFVNKTQAKMKWWSAATQRQVLTFMKSNNVMIRHDGYDEKQLEIDLENKKNMIISFDDILNIRHEDKVWGGVLNLEFIKNDKKEKYEFSVVQDWVKYPKKAPMKYIKADWSELVQYVKDRQKITN